MDKTNITALEEQFKKECKVIDLKYEYPGYTETERYGIITFLSEAELQVRYSEILERYRPYILLPLSFGEIRREYKQNEDKHAKRSLKAHIYGFEEGETEQHHLELVEADFTESLLEENGKSPVMVALDALSPIQRKRLLKHILGKKSLLQIAKEEGKNFRTVYDSYQAAIKKLKKILKNAP